ncbi:MAG: shikimate kinase [Candidatus Nanopelagicales bacterium]|nr:shikimate kinase [Candidatus Nanopelagicales bacterium]NKB91226.1 shikimate kinase [Candidatus Nanopelagicales bacterium]
MAPRAIIIGAPGAGKTSVGRRVAERLGLEFHDSDAAIEKRAGKPVSDIFLSDGETEFRRLEREVIAESLKDIDGVLSVGGGAVLDPDTREAFSRHTVVWLEVDLGNATKRVGMNSARPLLMGNVRGTMTTMLNERTPLYEEVATVTVDTSGRPLKDVVDDVVAELKRVGTPS